VSNPKVFEFAKEIGMTPLALMDKIKEWQLPIKNHMAELSPDMMAQLKLKLNPVAEQSGEDKPKKTATRKAAPKSTVAKKSVESSAAAAATDVKTPVIRRKTKEVEAAIEQKARVISKPEVQVEVATEVTVDEPVIQVTAAVVHDTPVQSNLNLKSSIENKVESTPAGAATVVKTETQSSQTAATTQTAATAVSRKKEVAIGDSGVSSSTNVASRRNIIGRMDLSRVQAPAGAMNSSSGGGFQRSSGGSGPRAIGSGGSSGGFSGPRPAGGFSGPRPGGAAMGNRNIRPGFVAQATIPDPTSSTFEDDSKRDLEKKARKFSGGGGLSAKEKEQEELVANFNAVEFRKREMVFQPKKKQGLLNRVALKTQITTPKSSKRTLKVNGKIKLSDMASEMGLKSTQIIKELMKNGVMANINTELDFDTVALTVGEFGWEAQNVFKTAEEVVIDTAFGELEADRVVRPPVVTVMGHVDHGKTSLLDAIRNAKVAAGEAGGITQHIGAYSVKTDDGSLITFLDTPGHEAFTAMRARGANATDIAIIVVAADDGMMPQTAEAINHAKAAGVPMIIAVNKIDKPGANPDKIKQQLTELEIVPEEWGGNTIFCEVSALKKTGIDNLLENIKLLAEVAELRANPKKSGTGVVVEAKLEKGRGAVATILVKDGHVKVGHFIVAGSMKGRVKSLVNDKGERVQEVGPGMPAEVLGLEGVPAAGDRFDVVKDDKTAEEVVEIRKTAALKAQESQKKVSLEDLFSKVTQGDVKEFNIVLKADVQGSLEAIQGMLTKLTSQEVKNKVIHAAVGGVTENDVLLAHTAKGVVIGFNVRPDGNAQAKAKQLGVDIRSYSIVYEMMDDLKKAMQGLLAPQVVEKVMGSAEVRNIFSVPKIGVIAGSFVTTGKIQRSNMLRLVREGKIIYEGKVSSLKRFKDDAKEVQENFECGIGIENFNDIKVGDTIEAFVKEEIARELTPVK